MAESDELKLGVLTRSLGVLLRLAQLRLFEDYFAGIEGVSLRPGELTILKVIAQNPGAKQGQIAQRLMIGAAHMTKVVRRLEDRGLVQRDIPDNDRRVVMLSVTAAGLELLASDEDALARHATAWVEAPSAKEEAQLVAILQKLTGIRNEL